jgi:hypothetical protein
MCCVTRHRAESTGYVCTCTLDVVSILEEFYLSDVLEPCVFSQDANDECDRGSRSKSREKSFIEDT